MTHRRLRVCALLATLLASAGCAGGDLLLDDRSLASESQGYTGTLRQWIRRRTRLLGLPGSEARRLEVEHQERNQRFHEFIVSVYTAERRWNDFDATPSMWRISLANDRRQEVSPVEVIRQDLRTGDLQAYFPYITVFQQAYLVRFPKQSLELGSSVIDPTTRSFSLRLMSGIAVSELTWALDKPMAAAAGM